MAVDQFEETATDCSSGPVDGVTSGLELLSNINVATVEDGYHLRYSEESEPILLRQIPSEGIAFQLWPAAGVMCWFIEELWGRNDVALLKNEEGIDGKYQTQQQPAIKLTSGDASALPFMQCAVTAADGRELVAEAGQSHVYCQEGPIEVTVNGESAQLVELESIAPEESLHLDVQHVSDDAKRPSGKGMGLVTAQHDENQVRLSDSASTSTDLNYSSRKSRAKPQVPSAVPKAGTYGALPTSERGLRRGPVTLEPSSVAGANQFLPKSLKGLKILELGSGTGMVGIVAARLGAYCVLTDLPQSMDNLAENARLNNVNVNCSGGSLETEVLRWGEWEDSRSFVGKFDLILASDCVYHEHLFEPLLVTLKHLTGIADGHTSSGNQSLAPTGLGNKVEGMKKREPTTHDGCPDPRNRVPVILLAHLRRWKKDSRFFRRAAKDFVIQLVHQHAVSEGSRRGVEVFTFVRKGSSLPQSYLQ